MSANWPVAMHDISRMPELQPDLETETVHAVERMTMHATDVTLFRMSGKPGVHTLGKSRTIAASFAWSARGSTAPRQHGPT